MSEFRGAVVAMKAVARSADERARELGIADTAIALAVTQQSAVNELVDTIDKAAAAEANSLRQLSEGVSVGKAAANRARSLSPDAPSGEIGAVVREFSNAEQAIALASGYLNLEAFPGQHREMVNTLFEVPRRQIASVETEVRRNSEQAERGYAEAQQEESTLVGSLFRGFRRGASQAVSQFQQFGTAAAMRMDAESTKLATAASQGLTNAVVAASTVAAAGIEAYHESQKSPIQRFLESKDGLVAIAIVAGLLIVAMLASA